MDRNQATGLIIISIMLLLYFTFFGGQPDVPQDEEQATEQVEPTDLSTQTTEQQAVSLDAATETSLDVPSDVPSESEDSLVSEAVPEEVFEVDNENITLTFSTKGGKIKSVLIKDYLTYNKDPLILLDEKSSKTALYANNAGQQIDLLVQNYEVSKSSKTDTTVVTFSLKNSSGGVLQQVYEIPKSGYQVNYSIRHEGMDHLLGSDLILDWQNNLKSFEKDPITSRIKTSVNYYTVGESFEELGERSSDLETAEAGEIKWMAFKQHFFTTGFIAKNKFSRFKATQEVREEYEDVDKFTTAQISIPADDIKLGKADFQFFFGPNSYPLHKKITKDFEENIYLGWTPVDYVNKWVIIPIFNWLNKYIDSYGIIIILLVLIIKIVLSPLSYKSYISMAKMKVMKPELDELKEKVGGDQQKMQQEQMKLYQQVGVNPLSGCIPMVLQMPILFAMFYFFPGSIELRQEGFLWADDLSTYDSIMELPFTIPLYGSHVSLFVLLMTASTILYTWSNNQMTTVQGPMKSMSYMMPLIFMFVLNSFPAALSFYYFVSNIFTFGQQALIRKFVDEDKIKAVLDENRIKNKGKGKSKFQQRLEQAMKAGEDAKKKKK
ncbi:MAG: membrane protein insertase YidC [Bacteroidota bacterium]